MRMVVILLFIPLLLFGCSAPIQTGKIEPSRISYMEGIVQSVSGHEVLLQLQLPDFKKESDEAIEEIARQVKQKAIIIEGMDISVEGINGSVKKVEGKTISISFNKAQSYLVGSTVKVRIPKKRIAIVDFTVIRGGIKEAGIILMERLSTELIESGLFTVVERSKLKPVLEEFTLIQSGLSSEDPAKFKPMLMIADIILTGTLSEISNNYDINLRLINVQTGQAITAVYVRSPLFKLSEMRDSSEWNEDFAQLVTDYSWRTSHTAGGLIFISKDSSTGAEGSKSSLRMDYDFRSIPKNKRNTCRGMRNEKKRDLSLYKGIEFYVKATAKTPGNFVIEISYRDDPHIRDRWKATFEMGTVWSLIKIPFDQLHVYSDRFIKKSGYKQGKQILDMGRVEQIDIGVCEYAVNKTSENGSIWIDKIRFYR